MSEKQFKVHKNSVLTELLKKDQKLNDKADRL